MKNWFREPWSKSGNRQGVDINLMPDNLETQFNRAESHVSPKGPFIVAAHAYPGGVLVYNGYSKKSTSRGVYYRITPSDLADMIKSNENWDKSNNTVILWACNLSDEYCQTLVNELGEGAQLLVPDGSITVGWVNEKNRIIREDGSKGSMKKFKYQTKESINE